MSANHSQHAGQSPPGAGNSTSRASNTSTTAGSPMPEGVLRKAFEVFPELPFIHSYGMTESTAALTLLTPRDTCVDWRDAGRLKSCGRPVPATEIRVVDGERREVPAARSAKSHPGAQMMLGYWNLPQATAEALPAVGATPATPAPWTTRASSHPGPAEGHDRFGRRERVLAEVENAIFAMPGDRRRCGDWGARRPLGRGCEGPCGVACRGKMSLRGRDRVLSLAAGRLKCPRSVEFRDTPLRSRAPEKC